MYNMYELLEGTFRISNTYVGHKLVLQSNRIRLNGCNAPYGKDSECMKCGQASVKHPLGRNKIIDTDGAIWWYLEEPELDDWLLLIPIMKP